jgi:hypothetical protein
MTQEAKIVTLPPETEGEIVRYLLDEMGDDERSRMEELMAREPSFIDLVESVEDELIMRYVSGDLVGRARARFTEVYMNSPAKRAQVESASTLRQAVEDVTESRKTRSPNKPWPRFAMLAAAAAILLFAVLWPIWRYSGRGPNPPPEKIISRISVALEPNLTRSDGEVHFAVPPGTNEVVIQLAFPNPDSRRHYRVSLGTVERPVAWTGSAVPKDSDLVTTVPAEVLASGDYTLQLAADGEELATYYFHVKK